MTVISTTKPTPGVDPIECRVSRAVARLRQGQMIVLEDDHASDEGLLMFAAEKASTALMTFMVQHTSGFICVALPAERCAALWLPPMSCSPRHAAPDYCVTFDAREGTSTGISARDRARGAKILADRDTAPDDLTRPGHLIPLRAADGRLLERPGRAEAAIRLVEHARLAPVAVLAELVSTVDATRIATSLEAWHFALDHGLLSTSLTDVVEYELAALDDRTLTAYVKGTQ